MLKLDWICDIKENAFWTPALKPATLNFQQKMCITESLKTFNWVHGVSDRCTVDFDPHEQTLDLLPICKMLHSKTYSHPGIRYTSIVLQHLTVFNLTTGKEWKKTCPSSFQNYLMYQVNVMQNPFKQIKFCVLLSCR